MALAKKCDRCGKLYEPKNATIKKQQVNGLILMNRDATNNSWYNRVLVDLCPMCLGSFDCWLRMACEPKFNIGKDGIEIGENYDDQA